MRRTLLAPLLIAIALAASFGSASAFGLVGHADVAPPNAGPADVVALATEALDAGQPVTAAAKPSGPVTIAPTPIAIRPVSAASDVALTVRIPPRHEEIRLACELGSNGDVRGVACKWSEAGHPSAAGYVLWRSVDGGPRERIYRTGLDGRRGHFDAKVKPGQTIRYAVIVVNKAGEPVGRGGPVTVRIPPHVEARPIEPRPTDTEKPADGVLSSQQR